MQRLRAGCGSSSVWATGKAAIKMGADNDAGTFTAVFNQAFTFDGGAGTNTFTDGGSTIAAPPTLLNMT